MTAQSTDRGRIGLVLAMFAVGLVGCAPSVDSPDEPVAATAPAVTPTEPRLVDRPCDTAVDADVDCYWLEVPERRDVADASTIRLWVAVVTPPGTPAGAVPLLPLVGGPGNAASSGWVSGEAELRPNPTPVVVVDQRGTGRSRPRLGCEHPRSADDVLLAWADRMVRLREAAARCREALVGQGVDLNGYDTEESAADLADLRAALDIDQWDVYGLSYGGRLARELYRQDPDGVRSLHLDSPLPISPYGPERLVTDAQDQVARVDEACHGSCTPSFEEDLDVAYRRLEDDPRRLTPPGRPPVTFDGDQFLHAVRLMMYSGDLIPAARAGVAGVAQGDMTFLDTLAAVLVTPAADDPDALAFGTLAAVTCADDGAGLTTADREVLDDPGPWTAILAVWPWPSCDLWAVDPVGDGTLGAASGSVPTLVTVGSLDILDPELTIADVTASLDRVTSVVVPLAGHVVARANDCALSITEDFRAHPTLPPDTSCLEDLPATLR